MFHKVGSAGCQGITGRSDSSPISHLPRSSNPTSDLKIRLETADTTRTLSSGREGFHHGAASMNVGQESAPC